MKFTRLPDEPKARSSPSRKLPALKPITLARRPEDNQILDDDGETVTTILEVGEPEHLAELRYLMKFGFFSSVVCLGLLLLLTLSPSQGPPYSESMLLMLIHLFLIGFGLVSFFTFLKNGFKFLMARSEEEQR